MLAENSDLLFILSWRSEMRRSAGMGGGSIMRAVGRAVGGAGVGTAKDAVSAAAVGRAARLARVVALPSSSSGGSWPSSSSVVAAATRGSMLCFCDEDEWEAVEGREVEVEEGIVVPERFVFGPVPSAEEAEEAVLAIQQMFVPVAFSEEIKGPLQEHEDVKDKTIISSNMLPRSLSTGSQSDWIEPSMYLYSSTSYQSREREKVLDAFRLLQINPSIQRVVVSLSSDRAVWDAVMKNDIVQEFKKSFYEEAKPQEADKGDDASSGILKWMMDAKAKIMEVLDKIAKHLNHIFQPNGGDKDEFGVFDDVLRSSFMLSVLVFIVVIMNRAQSL